MFLNQELLWTNSSFSKSRGVLLSHGPVVARAHIGRTPLFLFNMAEPSHASGKISTSVCLTKDDIPGAKLPKSSPEECSCWMLRRWLQCRRGRKTGKKAALHVQRDKAEVRWISVKQNYSMVNLNLHSGALARAARLRSTMGKKMW